MAVAYYTLEDMLYHNQCTPDLQLDTPLHTAQKNRYMPKCGPVFALYLHCTETRVSIQWKMDPLLYAFHSYTLAN